MLPLKLWQLPCFVGFDKERRPVLVFNARFIYFTLYHLIVVINIHFLSFNAYLHVYNLTGFIMFSNETWWNLYWWRCGTYCLLFYHPVYHIIILWLSSLPVSHQQSQSTTHLHSTAPISHITIICITSTVTIYHSPALNSAYIASILYAGGWSMLLRSCLLANRVSPSSLIALVL